MSALTPEEAWAMLTPEERTALMHRGEVAAVPPTSEPVEVPDTSTWAELDDFYDDELRLRHRDRDGDVHEYVLHAVDVKLGLLCQRLVNVGMGALTDYHLSDRALKLQEGTEETLDDSTEEELYRHLLGGNTDHPRYRADWDVWQQLVDEGAPWPLVRHLGVTAIMWAGRDRPTALAYWLDGRRPKAPDQSETNPPTPKPPRDRRPSSKGAGAGTTRKRASTSGTTPRKSKGNPGSTS